MARSIVLNHKISAFSWVSALSLVLNHKLISGTLLTIVRGLGRSDAVRALASGCPFYRITDLEEAEQQLSQQQQQLENGQQQQQNGVTAAAVSDQT